MSGFASGLCAYLLSTPLTYFLVMELNASAADLLTIKGITKLPASFGFLVGICADVLPLRPNQNFKPYLCLGWILATLGYLRVALNSTSPSIELLAVAGIISATGLTVVEVTSNAMLVLLSRSEPEVGRGRQQAKANTAKIFGMAVGELAGTALYNQVSHWTLLPCPTIRPVMHKPSLSKKYLRHSYPPCP